MTPESDIGPRFLGDEGQRPLSGEQGELRASERNVRSYAGPVDPRSRSSGTTSISSLLTS